MDNKKRPVLDVSSFLLVEGSADSEAEYGLLKLYLDVTIACAAAAAAAAAADDDDDAESCSCDTTDRIHGFSETFEVDDHREPSWSGCKMFLKDAALDCMIIEEGDQEESKVDINLSREVMDAMEDRLFWETCIALGYP